MKRITMAFLSVCCAILFAASVHAQQLTMLVDVSDAAWNSPGALTTYSAACIAAQQRVATNKPFTLVIFDQGGLAKARADELRSVPAFKGPFCTQVYRTDPFVSIAPAAVALGLLSDLTPLGPLYAPTDNWWNQDISAAPVDPNSASILTTIASYAATNLHPDFGGSYGIPYCVVDNNTPKVAVKLGNTSESDPGPYPIPAAAITNAGYVENGELYASTPSGDRHLLMYNRDTRTAFELSYVSYASGTWSAGYGAVFPLDGNYRRPEGWTSTDAAGLCVLAGLVRYDEVYGSEPIRHATRCSIKRTNRYVWPASHTGATDAGAPPLGTRFRLKASVDTSVYPAPLRRLFDSWKTYGLIVADRGGNAYIQGTLDARWDNSVLNPAFKALVLSRDFEVIQLGWKPTT